MTRLTFQQVLVRADKSGICPSCGRTVTRRRTFEQTLNPFNVNADATQKSRAEVRESVLEDVDAWDPDFLHQKCAVFEAEGGGTE